MAEDITPDTKSGAAQKPLRTPRRAPMSKKVAVPAASSPDAPAADLPVDTAAGQPTPPVGMTATPPIDVAAALEPVSAPDVAAAPVAEPQPETEPEVETVTAPVAEPIAAKENVMTDTVTSFATKAQEDTKAAFAKAGEQTRSALEKSRKVAEDMAEFGKGNMEALVEASRIAAQGFEALGHDFAAFARERYDTTATTVQSMASVKSPTELAQLQADYFRGAFDAMVKEASRSTEATLKLAGDVAKPLQNRFAIAADKFKVAA